MQELIKKVYQEKIEDGSIEKLIAKNIDDMVNDVCRDLFRWGKAKDQIKEQLESVMSNAIKQTDFENYVNAFKTVINATLENTSLGAYKGVCDSLVELLGDTKEIPETFKLSELFNAWVKSFEYETIDHDDFDMSYVEKGTYHLNIKMDVENTYGKNYDVKFYVDDGGLSDYCSLKNEEFKFYIYDGMLGINDLRLRDLRHMDNFTALLVKLHANFCNIEIDKMEDESEACLDVKY